MNAYFGLRDYGTASWDGGDPECDHKKPSRHGDKGTTNSPPAVVLDGLIDYYRDICGKCGARRVDRQIGLEGSVSEYVANIVAVFKEVRRVLRPDGTCWIVIGSSYAGSWGNQGRKAERGNQRPINGPMLSQIHDGRYPEREHNTGRAPRGYKPKDLIPIPWLVGIALQEDGWWLRADCLWSKPNPMPSSVTDRPTTSHEYVLLLTKQPRYYWDAAAVAEPAIHAGRVVQYDGTQKNCRAGDEANDRRTLIGRNGPRSIEVDGTRNCRSVWTIATQPFSAKGLGNGYVESDDDETDHFAAFPPELVERCVKAGSSEKGACRACGSPWKRVVEREQFDRTGDRLYGGTLGHNPSGTVPGSNTRGMPDSIPRTVGWEPGCRCENAGDPIPCVILDPFSGSGTTCLVSERLGRDSIGVDLSPAYIEMSRKRLVGDAPLFTTVAVE